jgi:hypothetical protein
MEWKTDFKKELSFSNPCGSSTAELQLETHLGVTVGCSSTSEKPMVSVSLYSYKRTFVIASAEEPVDSTYIGFSHRLKPQGSSIVKVTCTKK